MTRSGVAMVGYVWESCNWREADWGEKSAKTTS